MPDIFLRSGEANPNDIRLRDPTLADAGGAIAGTLSATLGDVTLGSTGQVVLDGDLAATLADLTLSSAGQVVIDGDLAVTLDTLTLASAGTVTIDADQGVTLDDLILSATATVSTPPSELDSRNYGGATYIRVRRKKRKVTANAKAAAIERVREQSPFRFPSLLDAKIIDRIPGVLMVEQSSPSDTAADNREKLIEAVVAWLEAEAAVDEEDIEMLLLAA